MSRRRKASMLLRALIAVLVVTVTVAWEPSSSQAQGARDSKGTDFWLTFPGNLSGDAVQTLFIVGDTSTAGVVAMPGIGFAVPFTVVPGAVTSVRLPATADLNTSEGVASLGIHVTASNEVTVYGVNGEQFSADGYLALPTDTLGTDYIILGYENVNVVNGSQFAIVASETTVVTITPTVTTGGRPAGVPYTIALNQGETYLLRNTSASPADLSGSIVTSTKPIAVFGGHQCANIPRGEFACDHLVEQLPPTSTWGQTFLTMPLATRLNGDTFRFLASTNGTQVSVNGTLVATLNRGRFFETILTQPSTITSSEPILVAQYANSSSFDNVPADPFMMLVPPSEQFVARYTIATPVAGPLFASNFVNVVAPTSTVGAITLDGVVIPAAAFVPIGTSGFSGARVNVSIGSHSLAGPLPFGVVVYGFDPDIVSYGYPGGLSLAQIARVAGVALTPEAATNPVGAQHCVKATVTDDNGVPLAGVRVDFVITGPHARTGFAFTSPAGEAPFCWTGTATGTDNIIATVGALSDTASKTWTQTQALTCDVDGDADVDRNDIAAINAARNSIAVPGDRRDANGDGKINVVDSRFCAVRCTRPNCAP